MAVKIQSYIPKPNNQNLVNNWQPDGIYVKTQSAPGCKIDHTFRFEPITATRLQEIYSHTTHLNFDRNVTPTLLLHLGSGFLRYSIRTARRARRRSEFDAAKEIGFVGSSTGFGFPQTPALPPAVSRRIPMKQTPPCSG